MSGQVRGICVKCGRRRQEKTKTKIGTVYYRRVCKVCRWPNARVNSKRRPQKRNRVLAASGVCSQCGFVADDIVQLDIDHINGSHLDNRPENLRVLCANCHRLKTKRERAQAA